MLFFPLLVSALVAGAVAAPAVPAAPKPVPHVVHEKRHEYQTQAGWLKRRDVPSGKVFPVRIGMKQRNLDYGRDLLMDISDPTSPKYGRHYTAEQVHDLFAPAPETVAALRVWLADHGITRVGQSTNKQWLQFDIPVEKLESLLQTKYHEFQHTETGEVDVACDKYHVPAHVQTHIDYITPGVKLVATPEKRNVRSNPIMPPIVTGKLPPGGLQKISTDPLALCDAVTTPSCISAMYNLSQGTTAFPGNQLGIFEGTGEYYSQKDLNSMWVSEAPYVPKGTGPIIRGIDGGAAALNMNKMAEYSFAGVEANLDFGAAIPLVYPQDTVLYQVDDYHYEEYFEYVGFLQNLWNGIDGSYCKFAAYNITGNSEGIDPAYPDNSTIGGFNHSLQCGVWKPTHVISISYGWYEFAYPTNYLQRQCAEIMKLALQGTTVVVSSGDYGVAGNGGRCMSNEAFVPVFPAACPYVLSVGSTYLPPGNSVKGDDEEATTLFPSGGGFSNVFPQPDYQKSAVNHFFKTTKNNYTSYSITTPNSTYLGDGLYNRAGRGFPDVAAIGENYLTFVDGFSELIGGTSLSAPVFASLITRINEARLAVGKGTVGYVHPAIYANPSMFHDITKGTNPGCGTEGFSCQKGWDPVTGLGTPKYGQMLEYFLSLP